MNMKKQTMIDEAKENCLSGKKVPRSTLLQMLELDSESSETEYLGMAAREVAKVASGNRGRIWAAVGVDYRPCTMNCKFCSFGEKWGLMKKPHELTDEEVTQAVQGFASQGASWIIMRTTQFYKIDHLCELASKIKNQVPGDYKLVANTGEFTIDLAKKMNNSGIDMVYHTIRLGEGKDTLFDPAERIRTLDAVRDSPLDLGYLVEPV